jgi:hypothetical protein
MLTSEQKANFDAIQRVPSFVSSLYGHGCMVYDDLEELHNIQHVANLPSILTHGILSKDRSRSLGKHNSVALQVIQDRRERVIVPNANRRLHSYANLYFSAAKQNDVAASRTARRIVCSPGEQGRTPLQWRSGCGPERFKQLRSLRQRR